MTLLGGLWPYPALDQCETAEEELGEEQTLESRTSVESSLHSLSSFRQSRILAAVSTLLFNVTTGDDDWSESKTNAPHYDYMLVRLL